jgi:hypothetical protein
MQPLSVARRHRFLESSLQSKGTRQQLQATAIYTNPAPLTYEQMKVRFEKSALQSAAHGARPAAQAAAAAPAPVRSTMLAPAGRLRNTETREAKIPLVDMKVTAATFAGPESPSSELSSKVQGRPHKKNQV